MTNNTMEFTPMTDIAQVIIIKIKIKTFKTIVPSDCFTKKGRNIKQVNCRKRSHSGLLGQITSLPGFTRHQGFYDDESIVLVSTRRYVFSQHIYSFTRLYRVQEFV